MPVPILPTKLYIPPQRSDLVPRPRLLDRLDDGLQRGTPPLADLGPCRFRQDHVGYHLALQRESPHRLARRGRG